MATEKYFRKQFQGQFEGLYQAIKNLSAELYAKDVHFLVELIQNAEDNEYWEGVKVSLEFIIISRDITATGAPCYVNWLEDRPLVNGDDNLETLANEVETYMKDVICLQKK
ncbi:hypothetical protein NE237_023116 [Protea cynaroides]|uniref:Uncharacterized protein n=1 Tax=Protea cynaroides TaxID=273540 RepID=A0A9Q0HFQ9_9MAGN|nr:hypothetical protein NE237_023116 [Protea cynaroides]